MAVAVAVERAAVERAAAERAVAAMAVVVVAATAAEAAAATAATAERAAYAPLEEMAAAERVEEAMEAAERVVEATARVVEATEVVARVVEETAAAQCPRRWPAWPDRRTCGLPTCWSSSGCARSPDRRYRSRVGWCPMLVGAQAAPPRWRPRAPT